MEHGPGLAAECKKVGPYIPIGQIEWECKTHNVELIRTVKSNIPAKSSEMICPIGGK